MIQEMENLITIDMEQTIQDWARVECSKYCTYFKRLKTDIITETYWTDKETKTRRKNNYGQELDVETYGGDTREEEDIHAGGVKWKKKRQNI